MPETQADGTPQTLKLGELPLIGKALARLGLADLIDDRVPRDKRSRVSTGECVEALIVSILTGSHTFYLVAERLAAYDLELGLGWTTRASDFHDERLARGADAFWKAGADPIIGAAFVKAAHEFKINMSVFHLDATTSPLHGDYANSVAPRDPEDVDAIPHVAKGRSKEFKPGTKQVTFGIAVSRDGAVPLAGRVASGNRSDSPELRYLMRRVAERVSDPSQTTVVGDSKLFSGETLLLAKELGFDYVTLLPKTTNLRGEALRRLEEYKAGRPAPLLLEKSAEESRSSEVETWRGRSFDAVYLHEDKKTKVKSEIPVRTLVVESSSLARQGRVSLQKGRVRERKTLEKERRALLREGFNCEEDARKAVKRLDARRPDYHRLRTLMKYETTFQKRPRAGRPAKTEERPLVERWRVWFEIDVDEAAFDLALAANSRFVLATSHPAKGPRGKSDAEVFAIYHDQALVEGAQHWLKGTLRLAPVFLKTEQRIAALGQIYVLALMVYALIQRDMRQTLAAQEQTIAGNVKPTAIPSPEVAFRLFENVRTLRCPGQLVRVQNLTTAQVHAYTVLGVDVLSRAGVVVDPVREPRLGERGFRRPRKRPSRRLLA